MDKRGNLNSTTPSIPNWRLGLYLLFLIGGCALTGYLVNESPFKLAAMGFSALAGGVIVVAAIFLALKNKKTEKMIMKSYLILSYILGFFTVLMVYKMVSSSIEKAF